MDYRIFTLVCFVVLVVLLTKRRHHQHHVTVTLNLQIVRNVVTVNLNLQIARNVLMIILKLVYKPCFNCKPNYNGSDCSFTTSAGYTIGDADQKILFSDYALTLKADSDIDKSNKIVDYVKSKGGKCWIWNQIQAIYSVDDDCSNKLEADDRAGVMTQYLIK